MTQSGAKRVKERCRSSILIPYGDPHLGVSTNPPVGATLQPRATNIEALTGFVNGAEL